MVDDAAIEAVVGLAEVWVLGMDLKNSLEGISGPMDDDDADSRDSLSLSAARRANNPIVDRLDKVITFPEVVT